MERNDSKNVHSVLDSCSNTFYKFPDNGSGEAYCFEESFVLDQAKEAAILLPPAGSYPGKSDRKSIL